MSNQLQISIPTTSESAEGGSKQYTLYHILWRLPMRSNYVKKRYNDFTALHKDLETHTGQSPPHPIPPKHYFGSTVGNPARTEERRAALESYLHAILSSPDSRWRDSPVWRSFLALPAAAVAGASDNTFSSRLPSGPITDPTHWLDSHRELKTLLHDARIFLSKRDGANTTAEQHEASAAAKRCLVKASAIISALDQGLQAVALAQQREKEKSHHPDYLLDGEIRRRRDLVAAARQERDALESLASVKRHANNNQNASHPTATADKSSLLFSARAGGGRVLGAPLPETERTRELGNDGVLQLQKTMLQEQDVGVESLFNIVRRQKQMGLAIGEELETQKELLERLGEDVDRVDKKTKIAKKRADRIS
ncbi:Phox homologous domain-containing protein [Tricharina praecox]|uniref:Phox homologous domain-containing protein n=1 Tax=Tricharina praecox TaxID=43433 RepID=UPI002220F703|nr:Phox homologous domain-containing protein [Tricharina praecox]KAI5853566.1 Phox homologous domain-containing protein [Tricharina praecox]